MIDFTNILSSDYQNFDYFKNEVLVKIFGNFDDSTAEDDYIRDNESLRKAAEAANIKAIRKTGEINTLESPLEVFEIIINSKSKISLSRVGIQNVVRRQLQKMGNAFMVFRYENPENRSWRFSFLQKGESQKDSTSAKRYTYVFGRDYNPRTANERFNKLCGKIDEDGDCLVSDDDLEEAFSVEALSDEFFDKYKTLYANFIQYITGKRFVKSGSKWQERQQHQPDESLYAAFNHDDKRVRDYVKKLLGRITFLYFVQKKGWFNGDQNYLQHLFEKSSKEYQDDFLDRVLEPFFYTVLSTEKSNRKKAFDDHNQNLKPSEVEWDTAFLDQWKDIPFLNGGLFERDEYDIVRSKFPPQFFENLSGYDENFVNKIPQKDYPWDKIPGVFDVFAQYNFTVDENDPDDAEVGIAPEMLGKIFENLLEDNKDKGTFYTPKEIVQYMCRESLIMYLESKTDKQLHPSIANLVRHRHVDLEIQPKAIARNIYALLENVKVCDPAIGSGVFPMGMLRELYNARLLMYGFTAPKKDFVHFEVKKSIIENNIYGVDIERGAVDIARLRFWLALVIEEEEEPTPLPNFDYKFMQGNSLLEQYEGIDLSGLTKQKKEYGEGYQITMFDDKLDILRRELKQLVSDYFAITDHATKQKMRTLIDANVQKQLKEQKIEKDFSSVKFHANQQFFLWHTWFADIFANGGFDVVIGNPPYFNIQALGAHSPYAEAVMNTYSDIWQDKSDILFYFFRLALDISGSAICFITSNAYLFSDKAKKLRNKMLESRRLKSIVNFEEYMVFHSASITTCITSLAKNSDKISAVNMKSKDYTKKEAIEYIEDINNVFDVDFKKDSVFALIDSSIAKLNAKIDGDHSQLRVLFKIGKGMETAANDVFCFSEYPRQFPAKYIKRRMCGDIIGRYTHTEKNEYMLYIEDVQKFEDLPKSIQKHLKAHKDVLKNRATCKNEGRVWWRYSRPMHKEYYHLDKIWCSYRSKSNMFALDESADYIGLTNTTVIFDTNKDIGLKYLLALLNSRVLSFRYKSIGKQTGSGVFEYFENGVGKLPIPTATPAEQQPIIDLVDRILAAKKANPQADTSADEKEIDRLVYNLYGLTDEEIKIINK